MIGKLYGKCLNQKVCEVFCLKDLKLLLIYKQERQEMICQCIIAASFASGRKQTSNGVVRDMRISSN